jgi:hypothetical protein
MKGQIKDYQTLIQSPRGNVALNLALQSSTLGTNNKIGDAIMIPRVTPSVSSRVASYFWHAAWALALPRSSPARRVVKHELARVPRRSR